MSIDPDDMSASDEKRLDLSIVYSTIASEPERKMIKKLLQVDFAEAKDLEEESELSRSAALNRASKLVDAGIIHRKIKPGTENRNKPPYIFYLTAKAKKHFVALLKNENFDNDFETTNNLNNEIKLFHNQQKDFLAGTQKLNLDTDSSEKEILTNPVSQQEPQKLKEHNSSLEERVGVVLTEMAKEIASLRSRVADLEEQFQKNPQNTKQFNFDNILNILETTQNGKNTT